MVKAWRWVLARIGGFGVFFMGVVVTPMAYLMARPVAEKWYVRIHYGLIIWGGGLLICLVQRRSDIKKEQASGARASARKVVARLRVLSPTQRYVEDAELDVLETGLREPPS